VVIAADIHQHIEVTMSHTENNEFWRNLKPIENSFKPGVPSELYLADPANSDERYFFPLTETVFSRPVWISPQQNMWADILWARRAGLVNRHYHPHQVFAYTLQGKWGYLEHDWTATKGDFVYETPGEGHTLVAHESDEEMKAFFIVTGPLIWLDENGNNTGHFDVHDYMAAARAHYASNGIGAQYIDTLIR
jgi:2,4'-dihydroxyacetophenone dioxygenase